MDHLIELVQFLSKNKFKHLEVFAKNSRLLVFYEKLRDGSLKTEAEARDFFFPNNQNAKTYYYRLAQQLEERLLSLLFLVDFNQTAANEAQRDILTCYRNYAAVGSLLARFMRAPAIKLAEETIKISLKNEFTEINLLLSRQLVLHYGTIGLNKKKLQHYTQILEHMQELLHAELLAEKYYAQITNYFALSRSIDLVFAKKIASYAQELKAYTDRLSSYRLNTFAYTVYVLQYKMTANYGQMIEVCHQALRYFQTKASAGSRGQIFNFSSHLMHATFMLRDMKGALNVGNRILSLVPDSNINWFSIKEFMLIIYLHIEDYPKALAIFIEVKNNPALSKHPLLLQERWRTNEAMFYYLIRTGRLEKPAGLEFKFRTKKFINEFSGSIHDKRGNNTVLITLLIMFLLLDKDYSSIIDKIDALKAYTHRHLRREEAYRTNCFIKMIMQLDKGDFHPVAVQRRAEPYYQKLLAVPIHKAKQDYDLELIPYETLWAFILDSLEPSRRTKVQVN